MDKHSVTPLVELLDSVRDIDGFPLGNDEDILALSDLPFYTVCPNPYIKQFIEEYGTPYDPEHDDYQRTPFVGDVSEGKNDPIYNAHSYHTKVPHKAIMKFIKHYTEEGDIVLDGFCGSGMTGVAAQLLNRKAILSDLSPAATFIAYNYNTPINVPGTSKVPGTSAQIQLPNVPGTLKVPGTSGTFAFEREATRILKEVEKECGWMYETLHTDGKTKGKIIYTVYSDVFICPYCKNEYVFWDFALNRERGEVKDEYECLHCHASITKRESERATISFFDSNNGKQITQSKQVPVLINYAVGKKRFEKIPDEFDWELIKKIEASEIPCWFPTNSIPQGDKTTELLRLGLTHTHHCYTKRNLWVLSTLKDLISNQSTGFIFTGLLTRSSKQARFLTKYYFVGGGGWAGTSLSGTIFIPSLNIEINPLFTFKNRIKIRANNFRQSDKVKALITTQSISDIRQISSSSVDYIFTDPPFGNNLMYSELNFLWEAWLKVFTDNGTEAIINRSQQKGLDDYKELMIACFKEYCRVLKPNRWMTVEFHNSKASVWNAIQEAITQAGFIIAQVAVLDKQQGSFNQVSASGAVKNDLIINAYKPKREFSERFLKRVGEGMEVEFVTQLLDHLAVKPNTERTEQMLYSRMLAHYVENGFKIRYNASNFYKLLNNHFTELDGYWFLDIQAPAYNEWKRSIGLDKLKTIRTGQQMLFISDEKSALTWLYNFLDAPQDYSDIYTAYQKAATKTDDVIPELRELLDRNFILEQGRYRRPMSVEEREAVNQHRERELDRAFQKLLDQARTQKGKIRDVRREALVHGFTRCYQQGRYHDILTVADKLQEKIIESSGDLMDFIDIARLKTQELQLA